MHRALLREWIWAEGRGPELRRVHFDHHGLKLVALDYVNPDQSDADVKHLVVHGAQVYMLTPEEVHNCAHDEVKWGPSIEQAAAVNLGKSSWLLSFAQQHLARCSHYRVMFYDEFLDVICEKLSAQNGPYLEDSH